MTSTIMEKYGRARIRQVVTHFYRAVLASRQLAHYFDAVDVQGLVDHQSAFLSAVMGGPSSHSPDQLERAHRPLAITSADYDEMLGLLRDSLNRHGVEPEDVDIVLSRYQAFREVVVGSESQGAR